MTRKEFLDICRIFGVGLPLQAAFVSCDKETFQTDFTGKVVIIGAGSAGLTAGYLLNQRGIDFEILEASSVYGGRMKRTTEFAEFPIPLGAEWLHVEPGVFKEIVNDEAVEVNVPTIGYDPEVDYGLLDGRKVTLEEIDFTEDRKFVNATWFDFFEQFIVPSVAGRITYNTAVESIDYSGEEILISSATRTLTANKAIITAPLKILQRGDITFSPELPDDKSDAINRARVWDGCKAFIEFSEKFYPTFTPFDITPETAGQKLYYDAAYGQNTTQHILGLFAVGSGAGPYLQLDENELIGYVLDELDEIYEGRASATYVNHIFQNWNTEPFIKGAYLFDHEDWRRVRTLGDSVNGKLHFAGEAYTSGEDWGSVHAAARAASRAVREILG